MLTSLSELRVLFRSLLVIHIYCRPGCFCVANATHIAVNSRWSLFMYRYCLQGCHRCCCFAGCSWYTPVNGTAVLEMQLLCRSLLVHSGALISCCVVARAQHVGQNSRFAQQPPLGWLRAGQLAIGALFSYFAGGDLLFKALCICCVCNITT